MEMIGDLRDCPWSGWSPGTLRFCESLRCEWIVAPAETWSNIGYFLVGFFLLFANRGKFSIAGSVRARFGVYALVVGVFSSLFHASHTYAFETADLAAMNFLGTELVVANLLRLGWLRNASPIPFAGLLFLGGLGLLFGTEGIDRLSVFGAFAVIAVFLEAVLFVRARRQAGGRIDAALRATYRPYLFTLALFLAAWACWIADYRRLICDPDQHFLSGHALWHLLNSGCFLTLSRFYERVSGLAPVRPAG
jgi:hypothetical protein